MIYAEGWWFETERFRDAADTEEEVNPGRYGEGLAGWVASELGARGWEIEGTFAEDWGWSVCLKHEECTLFVNCGNEDGTTLRWHVWPEARVGLLRRIFGKVDARPVVDRLDADLEAIISADPATGWCGREQPDP